MPLPTVPLLSHLFTESGDADYDFGNYTKYGTGITHGGGTDGSWVGGLRDASPAGHDLGVISPAFTASNRIQFSFEIYWDGVGIHPASEPTRRLITFYGTSGGSPVQIGAFEAYDPSDAGSIGLRYKRYASTTFLMDQAASETITGAGVSAWDESGGYPGATSPFNVFYTIEGDITFNGYGPSLISLKVDGVEKYVGAPHYQRYTSTGGLECTHIGFTGGRRASGVEPARQYSTGTKIKDLTVDRVLMPEGLTFSLAGGKALIPAPESPPSIMTAGGYQMPPAEVSPVVLTGGDAFVPVVGGTLSIIPNAVDLLGGGADLSILPGGLSFDGSIVIGAELAVVASAPRVFSDGPAFVLAAGSAMPISEVASMSMTAHGGRIDALSYGGADMSATAGGAFFPPAGNTVSVTAGAAKLFDPAFAAVAISAGAASYASNGPAYTLTAGSVDEPLWAGAPMTLTAGSAAGSVFSPTAAEITFSARRMPNAGAPLFVQVANGAVVGHSSASVRLLEETTARYTAQFTDESDANVPLSAFDTVMLTVYTKLGTIRATETALNENCVAISATGGIVWSIQPYETEITTGVTLTNNEEHFALWEWTHSAEEIDRVVSPFSTAADSNLVTVSHAYHGLRADDHVVVQGSLPVGGLHLDGLLIVDSVTNADTYVVRHKSAATSTASGGGACDFHINPQVGKGEYSFRVKKVDSI